MLKLTNIKKKYQVENEEITALDNISFEVEKSSFFIIVGPSGCGKSTLLRIIAGLVSQSEGQMVRRS
jgi:ABC-type sugar transport system ATPase subunit